MDFGSLNDYFEIVLSKRLSGTDIDRHISHGHELGGFAKLRPFLGDERRVVLAHYVYLDDEGSVSVPSQTTWYDSRWNKPHRGPEFRLYYPDVEPVNRAREGDLTLAALTRECQLLFVFVDSDSQRQDDVKWLFGIEDDEGRPFRPSRDMERRIDAFGAEVLRLLGFEVELPRSAGDFIEEMVELWPDRFPAGREFSRFARYASGIELLDDPDVALVEYYNTQTALFMAYEEYERERRLGPLVRSVVDPDYDQILKVAMSLFQRRRSAAGHALEYHLEALFEARDIRFTSQGITEGKEKPDFLFPGIEEYHDENFPSSGLTLLGAKTTAKDRWRQVLQEGDRVRQKHLLTLEPAITVDQTNDMRERDLQLVIPRPIHASYTIAQQRWIWTVGEFCDHVLSLQAQFARADG